VEAHGIKPVSLDRKTGRITGDAGLFATLPDPGVGAVLAEVFQRGLHAELRARLTEIAATPAGAQQINDATVAVASALLLCKTAMPHESETFTKRVREQTAGVRADAALVELALLLIEAERDTRNDIFRDRNVIPDSLFEQRIEVIKQGLRS
jgi:hypothetical protein